MTTQVVRPAGAGYETLIVLSLCALIVALAGAVVFVRTSTDVVSGVAANQFDARRDLSAAEQGLYADLRVAADEILFMTDAQGAAPSVADLAEQGLPPFVQDASAANRGAHAWQRLDLQDGSAYLGLSSDAGVAGSLLLRLPPSALKGEHSAEAGHLHGPSADIWLSREARARAPGNLDESGLLAAGWRQIAARFDAGVTRQRR